MVLAGEAVELLYWHSLHCDASLAGKVDEVACEVTTQVFLEQEFVDCLASLDGLDDGVKSKDEIHYFLSVKCEMLSVKWLRQGGVCCVVNATCLT